MTCSEDMSVRSIAQIMVVNHLRYTVVINRQCDVMGIVSADRIIRFYHDDIDALRARDILQPYTFTTTPATPLTTAIEMMKQRKIEHLIVVGDPPRNRSVLGMLYASDIVQSMAQNGKGKAD